LHFEFQILGHESRKGRHGSQDVDPAPLGSQFASPRLEVINSLHLEAPHGHVQVEENVRCEDIAGIACPENLRQPLVQGLDRIGVD
jgi:hypothetical protein